MKVTYVEGDMAKVGLGLSTEHRGRLMSSHISVVFHIAASVELPGHSSGNDADQRLASD